MKAHQEVVDILWWKGINIEADIILRILELIVEKDLNSNCLLRNLNSLIKKGANINFCTQVYDYGKFYTPLILALEEKMDSDLIEVLINSGAEVNPIVTGVMGSIDNNITLNTTDHPLRNAIFYNGRKEVIELLLKQGAKPNISQKCLNGKGTIEIRGEKNYSGEITPSL